MSAVVRVTPMSETTIHGAADALLALARDVMAGQARQGAPTIRIDSNGCIVLTYPDEAVLYYHTGVDVVARIGVGA